MTSPGARGAQQAYQQQAQNSSATFRRNTASHDQLRRRRGGPVRRLLGLVFSLAFVAIVVGILLTVLSAAQPDWFAWFDQLF